MLAGKRKSRVSAPLTSLRKWTNPLYSVLAPNTVMLTKKLRSFLEHAICNLASIVLFKHLLLHIQVPAPRAPPRSNGWNVKFLWRI